MKAVLAAALAVSLYGFSTADDKKADPNGTWKLQTDVNGEKRESTLTLKLEDDKLTGKIVFMDKMESKITDAKFKDGEATFSAERELMGTKFTIKYTLKIEGDTLKGKAEADVGGETLKLDVEGKREKKEK